MNPFEKYYPSPLLAPFIQFYIFTDIDVKNMSIQTVGLRIMPSPFNSLVLFFSEPSYKKLNNETVPLYEFGLAGFNTSFKRFYRNTSLKQMFICFTPIGLQPFLRFSLKEISNTHVSAKEVFGKHYDWLLHELCNCKENLGRINLVESVLIRMLTKIKPADDRIEPLVQTIVKADGSKTIEEIAGQLAMGERTLQRLIHQYIGINFKLFSRLVRFKAARKLLINASNTPGAITEIGYRLNYFDQSHFTHEFRKMSGQTPGQYLNQVNPERTTGLPIYPKIDTLI